MEMSLAFILCPPTRNLMTKETGLVRFKKYNRLTWEMITNYQSLKLKNRLSKVIKSKMTRGPSRLITRNTRGRIWKSKSKKGRLNSKQAIMNKKKKNRIPATSFKTIPSNFSWDLTRILVWFPISLKDRLQKPIR